MKDRTPQIRDAIVAAVPGVDNADDVTAAHLAAITILRCSNKSISALKAGDFSGLTALTELEMSHNSISDISVLEDLTSLTALEMSHNSISDISVLEDLTSLQWLYLSHNSISDISVLEDLTSLKMLWLTDNSISDISVLEDLTSLRKLTLGGNSISDISVLEGLTSLDLLWLTDNSISDVSALEGLISLTSLTLAGNAISGYGPLRRLKAANPSVVIDIDISNKAPVFADGISTTRSVAENTALGQNIGAPVEATDADNDPLTYTLGGTDAKSFSIGSTSGQLQTSAVFDYETLSSYSVSVFVSDSNGGSDSIDVTIIVTDVNEAPSFSEGSSTTRSVAENTASGQNIGAPVEAKDADNDPLTYTLDGVDADVFSIDSTSGQLQTKAALDYEAKDNTYTVPVSVSDGNGGIDSIDVTINVTNVNEAPSFSEGSSTTRSVAENTASGQNIGAPVEATDADNDPLTYTLGGTDAKSFSIGSTSGQLQTKAVFDYETLSSYSVSVFVSDSNGGSDSIDVTIIVTDVNEAPSFSEGSSTTRSVAENTASGQNIGAPVEAKDADNDPLTYTLDGVDADVFSIDSTSGQLQTKAALDYEAKDNTYTVPVSVSDGNGGIDSIDVTINVTNVNEAPSFSEGNSTTRSVAENTALGQNIGAPVEATDADNDPLTYTLGGTDAKSFSIGSTSGQLQTSAVFDYETLSSYSVSVFVSDSNGGSDSIDVTINVTDVNEAPSFSEGSSTTRSVAENTASGQNIGAPVEAKDADNDPLTYTLDGVDADVFSIDSTLGQLQTKAALDYEAKDNTYTVSVSVSDGNGGSDSITVIINVTDVLEEDRVAPSVQTPPALPATTALLTNFPNPFNPETWVPYQLAEPAAVTITIYDVQGRVVRRLLLGNQPAGMYRSQSKAAHWDGRNHLGEKVATGVYFYTLKAGDYAATRKMLIRK